MKMYKDPSGVYVMSLARGDEVNQSIENWAREYGVHGAKVEAIGAVESPELGYYDLKRKTYIRKTFKGIWELTPLVGNITLKDGEPFLHAHVVLGGPEFKTLGGHLFQAKTGVVVEVFITPLETPLPRIMCEEIGLPRWEPSASSA